MVENQNELKEIKKQLTELNTHLNDIKSILTDWMVWEGAYIEKGKLQNKKSWSLKEVEDEDE